MQNRNTFTGRVFAAVLAFMVMLTTVFAFTDAAFAATKLTVKPATNTITVGKSVKLTANKKVTWSVDKNSKVIKLTSKKSKTVSVKGLKSGTAYVKAKSGKTVKKIKVVVKKKNVPTKINLVASKTTLGVGEDCTIMVKSVVPSTASKDVRFSSSDKSVATVSSTGEVTAVSEGTVTITATSKVDSSSKGTIKITVAGNLLGTVVMTLDMTDGSKYPAGKATKAWVPIPVSNNAQKITKLIHKIPDATKTEYTTDSNGNKVLYVEWDASVAPEKRTGTVEWDVNRYAVSRDKNFGSKEKGTVDKTKFAKQLKATERTGSLTSGIIKTTSDKIVKDAKAKTVYDKAHAIYEWVCENVNARSVGSNYAEEVLNHENHIAGGCGGVNSVFVALCRAQGIPADQQFGIRLTKGNTKCRAKFYLPGFGWVEVDPSQPLRYLEDMDESEVLKHRGPNASGNEAAMWKKWKDENWFGVDETWMETSSGTSVVLSPATSNTVQDENRYLNADGSLDALDRPYIEYDGKYVNTRGGNGEAAKYTYKFTEYDPSCGC